MEKIAIVTGASRGIGREIAKELALKGIKVVANYNNSEEKALELKAELKEKGADIDIFKADVSKTDECKELVDFTIQKYGKVDILINNAGISITNEFTKISMGEWEKTLNVNLNSVFFMCKQVVPNMIHNKNGCIINISSVWGMVGGSCEVAYSTSKAGILGFSKALAKELGPSNIRVNVIAPGFIDTDMNKEYSDEDIKCVIEETPLEKIGNSLDIAKCINWLVEDEFTTGQVISINGGWVIT